MDFLNTEHTEDLSQVLISERNRYIACYQEKMELLVRVSQQQQTIESLSSQLHAEQNGRHDMETSLSWRITKPLRVLREFLSRHKADRRS